MRACSRCGKVHPYNYKCDHNKGDYKYEKSESSKLRSTNRWTQKSIEVRDKAHYLCEVCRDNGVITYDGLEVHHIEKLSDNKEGLLDNLNLVCLCQKHHREAESGEIDKEYLKELARLRET